MKPCIHRAEEGLQSLVFQALHGIAITSSQQLHLLALRQHTRLSQPMVSYGYGAGIGMGVWGMEPYHLLLLYQQIIFWGDHSTVDPLVNVPPGSNAEFQTYGQTDLTEPSGTNRFVRKKVGCQGWEEKLQRFGKGISTCMKISKMGLLLK